MTQPWSIYVAKGKNMESAWDFAQFLVTPPMAVRLVKTHGWMSLREDIDWGPLLKETPQLKPFVQWDQGRALYAEPALPAWDEIETKMAERLVFAFSDKSLLDNPGGIAKTIKDMAAQTDDVLKREGSTAQPRPAVRVTLDAPSIGTDAATGRASGQDRAASEPADARVVRFCYLGLLALFATTGAADRADRRAFASPSTNGI